MFEFYLIVGASSTQIQLTYCGRPLPVPPCLVFLASGHELQIFLLRTPLLCDIDAGPWGPFT